MHAKMGDIYCCNPAQVVLITKGATDPCSHCLLCSLHELMIPRRQQ